MKRIHIILLFLSVFLIPLSAAPEAEYTKLSKTYTFNSDGSQEYRYNMELTIFTHAAMNRTYGETFIVYNPQYQELKIHSSYTKQKDGTIIKTPENAFVEVLPRQAAKAPAFNHLKEMVVVHTGLELGATIYLDYTIISKPGYLPALDICEAIEQSSPVKSYTITIKTPEGKPLFYELSNSQIKPAVKSANGMKEVTWKISNLPAASRAPQATVLGGDVVLLTVSSFASNNEALKFVSGQLSPTDDSVLKSLSETATRDAKTDSEKLYAILNYVIENMDLSGLSLTETGFHLRSAGEVNNSAYGTEAEKVNMLAGMLNAAGIKAEIAAAYLNNSDINSCGLSAINELFVIANVDNKQFILTPKQKSMSNAGWYTDYAKFASISNPGSAVIINKPSTDLDFTYTIAISPEKAEIQSIAKTGESFIPYTKNYISTYTANDKEGKEDKSAGFTTFTYSTSMPLKDNDGYIVFTLPEAPNGFSRTAYKNYNSKRSENLLLPYKAKETYKYTIQLPDNIELRTPATTKSINNSAGASIISIKQNGNTIEVTRTLEIKKQLIKPADYAAFRSVAIDWAENNKMLLLVK